MADALADLDARIARLDILIAERPDPERGLGLRLALGLARELRTGTGLGSETAALLEGWKARFGDEVLEEAIAQARVLIRDPARLATEIGKRLDGGANDLASVDDLSGVDDPAVGGAGRA